MQVNNCVTAENNFSPKVAAVAGMEAVIGAPAAVLIKLHSLWS